MGLSAREGDADLVGLRVVIKGDHPNTGRSGEVVSEFPPFAAWWVVLLDDGTECGAPREQLSITGWRDDHD
jgi:hypothetical protein